MDDSYRVSDLTLDRFYGSGVPMIYSDYRKQRCELCAKGIEFLNDGYFGPIHVLEHAHGEADTLDNARRARCTTPSAESLVEKLSARIKRLRVALSEDSPASAR